MWSTTTKGIGHQPRAETLWVGATQIFVVIWTMLYRKRKKREKKRNKKRKKTGYHNIKIFIGEINNK